MRQKKELQAHEIRVVRIGQKAILNLIKEVWGQTAFDRFRILRNKINEKMLTIDCCFDAELCEIFFLAHRTSNEFNIAELTTYIRQSSIEPIDSLFSNPIEKNNYQTIVEASCVGDCFHAVSKVSGVGRLCKPFAKLSNMLGLKTWILRKREVRVIRLSKQAILELLWEHFMEIGDDVMDILEEESPKVMFRMHTVDNLKEMVFYAIKLSDVSDAVLEKVDEYCDHKIGFTAESLSANPAGKPSYISVMLQSV